MDDNPSLWKKEILGVKILGPFKLAKKFSPDSCFITGIGSPYNFWEKETIIYKLGLPLEKFETINKRFQLQNVDCKNKKVYQKSLEDKNHPKYPY